LGQKQPLISNPILASEWLLLGYTGHSPLTATGCFRPRADIEQSEKGGGIILQPHLIRSAFNPTASSKSDTKRGHIEFVFFLFEPFLLEFY